MKLEGERRPVFNTRLKRTEYPRLPPTREEAFREGVAFYYPIYPVAEGPCPIPTHTAGTSLRYTISGKRKCCAHDEALVDFRAQRDRGAPTDPTMAKEQGKDYYYVPQEGKYCGHRGILTLDGKCYICKQERESKRSPRQIAQEAGEIWYTPAGGDECKRCHTLARRRVANGSCEECERLARVAVVPSIREICPDLIISREDATTMGLKVYRTGRPCRKGHNGWRYVSTGNCLTCMGR